MAKKKTGSRTSARSGADRGLSRRGFLGTAGAASAAAGVTLAREPRAAAAAKTVGPGKVPLSLTVNGKKRAISVEPRVTLLRALRNQLGLTGTKEICNGGACGGCSVLVDGKLVNSCMMLALDAAGRAVTTIEGVSQGDKLHPLQQAFVKHDALQCGFCTPGMVMACKALLDGNRSPSLVQIKKALSGNLCRCGTYPRIFAAVQTAAKEI